jgi:hypothetical protein
VTPLEDYQTRLKRWHGQFETSDNRFRRLGNARLAVGIAAVLIAAISIGGGWISAWWLALPIMVFIWLAVIHERVERIRSAAVRAISHYQHGIAHMEGRWAGLGHTGDRFRVDAHLYADDLDLFGKGSLFELLSTARTAVGERLLADWLLSSGDKNEAEERQKAVAELCSRVDLREELALMGDEVRSAIDDRAMADWGTKPPVRFFAGARWIASILACAAVAAIVLFFAQVINTRALLGTLLVEMIFSFTLRDSVQRVAGAIASPSEELKLLRLVLERLEKESFESPRLKKLTHSQDSHGLTPSGELRRLERLVNHLDSARNQFFRFIAAPLLWIPQFSMAIEAWRQENGPRIGEWIATVGEFEALCSLASFAYERPDAVFPEFVDEGPVFEAEAIRHPLIDASVAVANDVRLDAKSCALWVVSGSNMSGKSTLLRSVGVNAILAWAGAPVACGKLRISPLQIGASIRVNDSLADNRSRFYAEITRLRQVMDLANSGKPALFLLDELLSGTNSHDRRIGAAAVVRGLVERGAIGLVTTHDLALADIATSLESRAKNVHFEDHMEAGEIHFDYKLRQGVVERSNALELMRAVGLDV